MIHVPGALSKSGSRLDPEGGPAGIPHDREVYAPEAGVDAYTGSVRVLPCPLDPPGGMASISREECRGDCDRHELRVEAQNRHEAERSCLILELALFLQRLPIRPVPHVVPPAPMRRRTCDRRRIGIVDPPLTCLRRCAETAASARAQPQAGRCMPAGRSEQVVRRAQTHRSRPGRPGSCVTRTPERAGSPGPHRDPRRTSRRPRGRVGTDSAPLVVLQPRHDPRPRRSTARRWTAKRRNQLHVP